jgi:hypothetical protein
MFIFHNIYANLCKLVYCIKKFLSLVYQLNIEGATGVAPIQAKQWARGNDRKPSYMRHRKKILLTYLLTYLLTD